MEGSCLRFRWWLRGGCAHRGRGFRGKEAKWPDGSGTSLHVNAASTAKFTERYMILLRVVILIASEFVLSRHLSEVIVVLDDLSLIVHEVELIRQFGAVIAVLDDLSLIAVLEFFLSSHLSLSIFTRMIRSLALPIQGTLGQRQRLPPIGGHANPQAVLAAALKPAGTARDVLTQLPSRTPRAGHTGTCGAPVRLSAPEVCVLHPPFPSTNPLHTDKSH
ncbi:hypothetical protein FN846DRAFT_998434, partial [Sphaerosporella brunnea]